MRWDAGPDGRAQVQVTPKLIRVNDDNHIWTQNFDAELTGVLRMQGMIAEQVAAALDLALDDPEREALRAPIALDANSGSFMVSSLARAHVLLGEPDQAIELLEPLLKIPSWVSMPALRADPVWRPIWGHPRFRTLLAGEQ